MERMEKQEIINIETLFRRLLGRQMFPWNNQERTIGEAIACSSQSKVKDTLMRLEQNVNIQVSQVIERIIGRAKSWNYSKFLDHSRLLEIPLLRNF